MITVKLTGKIRYRLQKRLLKDPLLILQVEETHVGYVADGWGGTDTVNRTIYRDATVEDLRLPAKGESDEI